MNAIFGVLLLAASTVLFSWAFIQVRRPNPRPWADSDLSVQLIVFTWIVALCAGVGLLAKAIDALETEPLTATQYAAVAAILVTAGALHYLLRLQWRGFKRTVNQIPGNAFHADLPQPANDMHPVTQDNNPHSRSPRAA